MLDVRDMPLRQVVDAIEVFLEKSIALDAGVDPERNVEAVHVEEGDWMAVLNKFAEGEGLFEEAETNLVLTATQPSDRPEDANLAFAGVV